MSTVEMLTPQNSAIALIDYQPAMFQGVQSHDRLVTFNNVQVLAKAAKLFGIPTIISTVAENSFSGPFMPEVIELFPDHDVTRIETEEPAMPDTFIPQAAERPPVRIGAERHAGEHRCPGDARLVRAGRL